jgi:hypothetical protein
MQAPQHLPARTLKNDPGMADGEWWRAHAAETAYRHLLECREHAA